MQKEGSGRLNALSISCPGNIQVSSRESHINQKWKESLIYIDLRMHEKNNAYTNPPQGFMLDTQDLNLGH